MTPLDQVFRDEWGGIVASLIGFLGDFDLADESAQEAFAIAAERWPRDGLPRNPRGWLLVTARNRAVDRLRLDRTLASKVGQVGREEQAVISAEEATLPDERLRQRLQTLTLSTGKPASAVCPCCREAAGRNSSQMSSVVPHRRP